MSLPPTEWLPGMEAGCEPDEAAIPWEDSSRSSLPALLLTLRRLFLHPKRFFASLPSSGGLGEPLGFVLLVGTTGVLGAYLWQLLLEGSLQASLPEGLRADSLELLQSDPLVVLGLVLMTPLYVVAAQFIFTAVLFAALHLLTPAVVSFAAVFRVTAYSQAAAVFYLIPWVGQVAAWLGFSILLLFGLTQTLHLSIGRLLFALVQLLLLLLFVSTLFFLLPVLLLLWSFLGPGL